jgi:hypothetical protein
VNYEECYTNSDIFRTTSHDLLDFSKVKDKDFNYTPGTKKSKIYIYSGTQTSRTKIRDWCNKNNAAITRKVSDADYRFIDSKGIHSLHKSSYCLIVNKTDLINFIDQERQVFKDIPNILQLKDFLSNHPENEVILDLWRQYKDKNILFGKDNGYYSKQGYKYPENSLKVSLTHHISFISSKHPELIQVDDNELDISNLYNIEKLISLQSSDAPILTKESKEQIEAMFNSSNTEDRELALEMLCNFNYNENLYYFLELLQKYARIIRYLKGKSHVNYKTLLKYLNISDPSYLSRHKNLEILMDKEALKTEHIKDLADNVFREINNGLSSNWVDGGRIFSIKGLEIRPESKLGKYISDGKHK